MFTQLSVIDSQSVIIIREDEHDVGLWADFDVIQLPSYLYTMIFNDQPV